MKKIFFIIFLSNLSLWSQDEAFLSINKKTISSREGYLISNPYHSIYDNTGWLWILGESTSYKNNISGKNTILQRFDGVNFFSLKMPNISGKKVRKGYFLKNKKNILYLKLYYKKAETELFFIDTETLEIKAVDEYNNLTKKYRLTEEYIANDKIRLVLANGNKLYSAEINKLNITFKDSITIKKIATSPIFKIIKATKKQTIVRLLTAEKTYLLDKDGKISKKNTEVTFVDTKGNYFYPNKIYNTFKVKDKFYHYFNNYKNLFKYNVSTNQFLEIPNTSKDYKKNKLLRFSSNYKTAYSNEFFKDYNEFKLYHFNNFEAKLITKIKTKKKSNILYNTIDKSLLILDSNIIDIYRIHEDKTSENNKDKQPQFTSISFFDHKNGHWKTNNSPRFLNNVKTIELPSEYRRFTATISFLGQTIPKDAHLRYRLLNNKNSDSNWFLTNSGNKLLFANLASGSYLLQIKATNNKGELIGKIVELKVISQEVFYKTWWFITLLFLIALGIIGYVFYQYKIKRDLNTKNKIAVNEAEIKTTMMLEIHHRIKNNLQIISGLLGLQMANSNNDELKLNLQDSQSRIESIAGIHNILYQSNNQYDVSLKNNINSITNYYKTLFPIKDITYNLNIDASIISIDKATPLSLLLNELINNSNKHAFNNVKHPEITINFNKIDEEYLLEYFDNGNFQKIENRKESMGMKIIGMMNKQLKGNLKIEDSNGFKLTLFFS
ncbi:MAG: sensor histidine kinase [Polaribacter sp.]|uniref:sensor histidine kinase n=1 Tax=Polaribacter sp. TaxID=1920175 RepID=UPI0032664D32